MSIFWKAAVATAVVIFLMMIFTGNPTFWHLAGAIALGAPVVGFIAAKAIERFRR